MDTQKNLIGERIKNLRLQKMMTQKELCGGKITRNMLSAIENGNANPSLDTLIYLAKKLNVSPGLLLSEGENNLSLKKLAVIDNIRQAFERGSYSICAELCSGIPEDDEINFILSHSYISLAKEAFDNGEMHKMCSYLDKAVYFSEHSVYSDFSLKAIASRYFKYANEISSALFSENLSEERTWKEDISSLNDEFCRYLLALDTLKGKTDISGFPTTLFSFSKTQYIKHLNAVKLMSEGKHSLALPILKELIYGQTELGLPIVYNIMRDAELCSKEIDNYRDAYDFSNSCISLLDSILKQ